ncbi:MAG TPA: hypothetical protein VE824_01530 [Gaiellales bacterium]|nr:hypothetical protein [Gaiellales bacterium]
MRYEPTYGVTRAGPRPRAWLRLITLAVIVAMLWGVLLAGIVVLARAM